MSNKSKPRQFSPPRRAVRLAQGGDERYTLLHALPEPTVCPQCNAVFQAGRWCWGDIPKEAHHQLCPACHRQNDNFPAGFVSLGGQFFVTHRDEIVRLINREEERERREHPLKRIMTVEQQDDTMLVTTTDTHLARGIGEAVHRLYRGDIEFDYNAEEDLLRVNWAH